MFWQSPDAGAAEPQSLFKHICRLLLCDLHHYEYSLTWPWSTATETMSSQLPVRELVSVTSYYNCAAHAWQDWAHGSPPFPLVNTTPLPSPK